jgi:hypothetical protein
MEGNSAANTLNIYVESGDAQQKIDALITRNQKLQDEVEGLRQLQGQADAERKTGNEAAEKQYKSLSAQIQDAQKALDANTQSMDRQAKKVSGELSPSVKDLEAAIRQLTREQKNFSQEDAGFGDKAKQISEYKNQLQQVQVAAGLVSDKLKEGRTNAGMFAEGMMEVATGMGLATSAEAVFEKGLDFMKESIKETTELELGQKRLATSIKNWGNTSEGALERFNEKAESLSKKFGYLYSPEITKVQDKLVLFGRMSEEQINKVLPVIVNFAAQTGQSMDEATQKILMAFEGNGRAVKQFGIELKKDEGFAVNYGVVMDQLASKVDGAAEAFDNSAAGGIARYQKEVRLLQEQIGGALLESFGKGARGASNFVAALRQLPAFVVQHRQSIIALAGAVALYNVAVIANTIEEGKNLVVKGYNIAASRLKTMWTGAEALATQAATVAQALWTGEMTIATLATQAWGAALAIASGGMTVIVGAIIAAGAALAVYAARETDAEKATRSMNDVREKATKATIEEKLHLEELVKVAKDEKQSKEARQQAIEKINQISPEYLGNISLENIGLKDSREALDKYVEALDRKAKAQAIEAQKVELLKRVTELQTRSLTDQMGTMDKFGYNAAKFIGDTEGMANVSRKAANALSDEYTQIQKQIKALDELSEAMANNPDGTKSDADKNKDEAASFAKYMQDLQQTRNQYSSLNKSSDEKEVNEVQEHLHALSDKLEEYRHNGLISLQQYYQAKEMLDKQDKYKDLVEEEQHRQELAKKTADARKKRMEDYQGFKEQQEAMRAAATNKQLEANEKELADIRDKYKKQTDDLSKFLKDGTIKIAEYVNEKNRIEETAQLELNAAMAKQKKDSDAKDYDEALTSSKQLFEMFRTQQTDKFNQGLLSENNYHRAIEALDLAELRNKKDVAEAYEKLVDKAGKDKVQAETDADKKVKDIGQNEKNRLLADIAYIRDLKKQTLKAEGKDYEDSTKEKLELLKEGYLAELVAHGDTAEKKKAIDQKYAADSAKIMKDSWQGALKEVSSEMSEFAGDISKIATNISAMMAQKEDQQLARDKKANTQMTANYKHMLDSKQISQAQYDKLTQAAAAKMAKEEDDAKRKQFDRDKAMKLTMAIINTALAVINAMATAPNFIMGAIEAAAAGIAGAVEIATIAKSQYVSTMAEGGMLGGDRHSDPSGGTMLLDRSTRAPIAMAERGEFVTNKESTANNSSLLHLINTSGRSRPIADMVGGPKNINSGRVIENSSIVSGIQPARSSERGSDGSAHILKDIHETLKTANVHHETTANKPVLSLRHIHEAERKDQYRLSQKM